MGHYLALGQGDCRQLGRNQVIPASHSLIGKWELERVFLRLH